MLSTWSAYLYDYTFSGGEGGYSMCNAILKRGLNFCVGSVTEGGGGWGVKNCQNLRDVIYECSLRPRLVC